ncbi:MAG: hypothetical protein V4555_20100 [Acidobacteriota bacterium]
MPNQLTTPRTIAIVVSSLGLLSACGLGYHPAVIPPPPLNFVSLSATILNFSAEPGTSAPPQTVTLTNAGSTTIRVLPPVIPIDAKGDVFQAQPACPKLLEPKDSCTVTITFSPNRHGVVRTWVDIPVPDAGPTIVSLIGTNPNPHKH